jgi:hypothetical protein
VAILTDYYENKIIDFLFRGQTLTPPTTQYIALFTVTPSDTGGGTEVSGGSYARVGVVSSMANWAGTQSSGSTTASSGTGGQTSNNGSIAFTTASGSWGTVVAVGAYDASSSGNLLWYMALTTSKTVGSGDTASFSAGSLTITID